MVVQAHVKPAHAGRDPLGRSESDGGLNGNASAVTAVVDTSSSPLTWLALAAGWSGGPLSAHPKALPPVPPYLTARAVRIAVLLSAHALEKDQRGARLQAWIAEAIALAQDGLGHVGIW